MGDRDKNPAESDWRAEVRSVPGATRGAPEPGPEIHGYLKFAWDAFFAATSPFTNKKSPEVLLQNLYTYKEVREKTPINAIAVGLHFLNENTKGRKPTADEYALLNEFLTLFGKLKTEQLDSEQTSLQSIAMFFNSLGAFANHDHLQYLHRNAAANKQITSNICALLSSLLKLAGTQQQSSQAIANTLGGFARLHEKALLTDISETDKTSTEANINKLFEILATRTDNNPQTLSYGLWAFAFLTFNNAIKQTDTNTKQFEHVLNILLEKTPIQLKAISMALRATDYFLNKPDQPNNNIEKPALALLDIIIKQNAEDLKAFDIGCILWTMQRLSKTKPQIKLNETQEQGLLVMANRLLTMNDANITDIKTLALLWQLPFTGKYRNLAQDIVNQAKERLPQGGSQPTNQLSLSQWRANVVTTSKAKPDSDNPVRFNTR